MPAKIQKLINFFKKHGGVARFTAIRKAGFHPDSITCLVKKHEIEKIGRGLYRLSNRFPASHPDIITASLQSPRGIICLISALSFYEATTEIPKFVDIAVPRGAYTNRIKYPPVRFYRFSSTAWKAGIEEHTIESHTIKVYSHAKTIADCFKFRNKIGMDIVREAIKTAISEKNIKPNDIMYYAKICRVENIMKPILEIMI